MDYESKIVFESDSLKIGRFRCAPASHYWQTENLTRNFPTIVFPRTAVEIHQVRREPVVATPNHVMLYNPCHSYYRSIVDPRGDRCEFYCLTPEVLEQALRSVGAKLPDCFESPFGYSHAPCSSGIYLAQRAIFRVVEMDVNCDPLFIEESFLMLLPRLLDQVSRFIDPLARRKRESCVVHRSQVESAKEFIGRHFREPISLADIAHAAECSVFHLCRKFKKLTGDSIHRYLVRYRLRSAIESVCDDRRALTDVALDLSFSSHSHFSNAFRKEFSSTPKLLRTRSPMESLQWLLNG